MLDAGNSGTTIRLMSGVLAGQPFASRLDGDSSLRKRPMSRVLNHLVEMGANVAYLENDNYPPFEIRGGKLQGKRFALKVASAQVQTALILAGLQADGETVVELPAVVRDHTERMLKHAGVPFVQDGLTTRVSRLATPVAGFEIKVAGDISSAAFFMVAAACLPGSELRLPNVGLNPGRTLVLDVLREMGADIALEDEKIEGGEPTATLVVKGTSRLKGVTIGGDRIAAGIDEIPILSLAGALCDGTFAVRDASELRVKESDRLALICSNLRAAGAKIDEFEDGFDVHGI
jgi:3-phosphoshikimate 1-carboxyvinyltransferase